MPARILRELLVEESLGPTAEKKQPIQSQCTRATEWYDFPVQTAEKRGMQPLVRGAFRRLISRRVRYLCKLVLISLIIYYQEAYLKLLDDLR